jgi:uncharacterized membrane protein YedE/YeeE
MLESILSALAGGAILGVSASLLLLFSGRVAGISGIVGRILTRPEGDTGWRLTFLAGLLVGGAILAAFLPSSLHAPTGRSLPLIVFAGLMVGFGTRLGNGCTSGHGICGLTRFSGRSAVATLSFMFTGFLTASMFGLFFGTGS